MLFLTLCGCAQSHKPFAAPTLLPGTDRSMLTPGYWISRHPSPDAVILTSSQIDELNLHIEKDLKTVVSIGFSGTRQNISRPLPYSGSDLATTLRKDVGRLRVRPRYLLSGRQAPGEFYERLAEYMDMATANSVNNSDYRSDHGPDYGIVVRDRGTVFGPADLADFGAALR